MTNLFQTSIELILENQSESGAFIASPNFSQYGFCWLRDSSFIAHAMDRAGEYASARSYFLWVHRTIQRYAGKVDRVLSSPPETLEENDYLHTRYTLDGRETDDDWSNFQLDGYGAWLWALREHVERSGDVALCEEVGPSIDLTVRYISTLWSRPNYDYWEENGDRIHPSTLAALYAGLVSADALRPNAVARETAVTIREFVLSHGVQDGHFVKYLGTDAVDASLVALSTPFRLVDPGDATMCATIDKIERDLVHNGGTHRFVRDVYYGGGEWCLLSAWLGWYRAETGDRAGAEKYLAWVEAQADDARNLPEQVTTHALYPEHVAEWQAKWGEIARPLLWSHAMYIILSQVLNNPAGG